MQVVSTSKIVGQPEVEENGAPIIREQDIVGFDVEVSNAVVSQVRHCVEHVGHDDLRVVLGEPATLDDEINKITSLHVRYHH